MVICNNYYRNLINKVKLDEETDYFKLARKYKTTVDNVIIAVNFDNRIHYLQDEEIDMIKDSSTKVDVSELDDLEYQIYELRVKYNLSQKEIAEKLQIHQSTISRKLKVITRKVFSINV